MSTTTFATPTRTRFDEEIEEKLLDEPLGEEKDWWCVSTSPFPCPAENCNYIAHHLTAAHRIIVWPEMDDRYLLSYCADASKLGRNPKPVPYERSLGPCISFDAWRAIGCPIHAKLDRPEGTGFRHL